MKKHDVEQIMKAFSKKYGKQAKEIENAIRKAMANGMSITEAVKEATKETEAWMTSHVMESMLLSVSAGSGVNFEELPPALTNAWDASGMKLSKKIHGTTKEMRSAIISTLCKAQKDGKKVIETARALYDGYGYGHVTRTQPLPDYLDKVLTYARRMDLSDKDKAALMREIRNAKRATERLSQNNAPNRTLKAVYKELVTHIERSEDRMMERSLKAAVEEKSRYIAERIARTESARAWADGFIARYGDDEDVVAYQWKTGSRHPEEDICDMYANANLWNLGKGIFPKDKCPILPIHPHCLCHLAPVFVSEVDIDNVQDQRDAATCDWLKGQNENTRENLLGVKGNKAWEEGRKTWRTVLRNYSPKVMKSRIDYLPVEQPRVKTVGKTKVGKRDAKGNLIYAKDYLVNTKVVNSKSYREKFEKLPVPKQVQDALHKEAIHILNEVNGKGNEIVSALDARTGEILARSDAQGVLKSSFTKKQYEAITSSGKKIVLLHNHPGGGRFSFTDIKTCFNHDMIDAGVVVGHDGSVRIIHDFDRRVDIESLYRDMYNEAKEIYPLKDMAKMKALTSFYEYVKKNGGFKYERSE